MKKIGILLCAVCCMLYSCTSAPHSDDSRSETSVIATESIAESDSAEPADLSAVKTISELVRYMYQVAQAPEKNLEDSDKPMAPGDGPSSKATLWVKAQHEGALTPPCIVRKRPQVTHTAQQVPVTQ